MNRAILRGAIALIWLGVAVVILLKGDYLWAGFNGLMAVVFGYSAYSTWRKDKNDTDKKGR